MEWQLAGEDSWDFGVKVRGAVRASVGQIYFDPDLDSREGGWVWMAFSDTPTRRGLAPNRREAMARVEEALGVVPESTPTPGRGSPLTDEELAKLEDGFESSLPARAAAEIRRLRMENQAKQDALEMAIRDCTANGEEADRLRAQVAGLLPAWTEEPPAEPGWYWRQNPEITNLIIIESWSVEPDGVLRGQRGFGIGEWAGPLTPPA